MRTIIIFILCLFPFLSSSQNLNHWNNFFGSESNLLLGSNIASVMDYGAVFHNPANVVLINDKKFDLSLSAYAYSKFVAKNKLSQELSFTSTDFNSIPSLLAGDISFLGNDKNKFSYSYLSRTNESKELVLISKPESVDVFGGFTQGNELINNSVLFKKKFSDNWVGLTWSSLLSDKISIGVSSFVSIVNGFSSSKVTNNILMEESKLISASDQYVFKISSISSINKLGFNFSDKKLNIGATLTLPSMRIMGKGNYSNEYSFVGYHYLDSTISDEFASNQQKKIKANYYRPGSLAIGLTYKFNKLTLTVSGEYFSGSKNTSLIALQPYQNLTIDKTNIESDLILKYKPAINYSVGIEFAPIKNISTFISYARDNNPFEKTGIEYNHSQPFNIINADYNKLGLGFRYKKKKINLVVGLTYMQSNSSTEPNFELLSLGSLDSNEEESTNIKQTYYQLFFGFSLPLSQ